MRLLLAAALALTAAAPCAAIGEGDGSDASPGLQPAGGLVLFYESTAPLSFVTMTPKDVPADAVKIREVKGVSCQYGLAVPTSLSLNATNVSGYTGDGSFAKAIAQIKRKNPGISGIYDVREDVRDVSILGFFNKLCTIVTARGFALSGAPAPEPVPAAPK